MRSRLVLVTLVVVLVASCQWPHHRGNAALTGHQTAETQIGVANVSTLVERWRSPNESGIYAAPTVLDGRVHTTSGSWAVDAGPACSGTPVVCPRSTLLPSGFSNPYAPATEAHGSSFVVPWPGTASSMSAFDAAGIEGCAGSAPAACQPRWTTSTDPYPTSSTEPYAHLVQGLGAVTVAGSTAYAANQTSAGGRLYAFDAKGVDGCSGSPKVCRPLWATDEGAFPTSVAVAGGRVYAIDYQPSTTGSALRVYDAKGVTGCSGSPKVCQPLWTGDFGVHTSSTPGWTSPVVDGIVYAIVDTRILAFDATGTTGCAGTPIVCQPLWTAPMPGSPSTTSLRAPAVADGRLFVPTEDGVYSFDATGTTGCAGAPKECQPLAVYLTSGAATAVTVANGVAYVGGSNGVFAFDAAASINCSGEFTVCTPLWHALDGLGVNAPAVVNGQVHVAVPGRLHTFGLP